MRKVLLVILTIALMVFSVLPAYAAMPEEDIVSPNYNYIQKFSVGLNINQSSGIASCTADCISIDGYTVKIEYKLQQYVSTSWTTVKTWTASGTDFAAISENRAVNSGYTYRGYVTFRIYNSAGSLLESTVDTQTYYYPSN